MSRARFTVGDWVSFRSVSSFVRAAKDYEDGTPHNGVRRKILREDVLEKPLIGVVVGLVTRYEGYTEPASGGWEDYEPAVFVPERSVRLWQVRTSLRGKIYEAQDDAVLALPPESTPKRLPDFTTNQPAPASYREFMRGEMAAWPRDDRGRWKKSAKEAKA